jgi:glyoxylate reductase
VSIARDDNLKSAMLGRTFVTRPIFEETMETLRAHTEVRSNSEDRILSKSELIENLQDVDGVITLVTDRVDRDVLQNAGRLKVVAHFGVGYNNVDVESATALGVVVTNTPGVLTETTADLAWSLLMAVARRIAEGDRFVRAGRFDFWGPKVMLGHDVYGKTLGIVGLGRIGQAMARRAHGFSMKVLCSAGGTVPDGVGRELNVEAVPLEELFRRADFITFHVPLRDDTHHLLNESAFSLMKPTAIVVNTSRGPVVDEKALVAALRGKRIAGAGLDVFEREPHIEPELLELDNVVLAPHVGSASYDTRLKMSSMTAENLIAVLKSEKPPNMVNPSVWDRRRR